MWVQLADTQARWGMADAELSADADADAVLGGSLPREGGSVWQGRAQKKIAPRDGILNVRRQPAPRTPLPAGVERPPRTRVKRPSKGSGVDTRYNAILSQMHRVLGKKITSNLILDRAGKSYFGSKVASRASRGAWLGVFSQDVKPPQLLRRAKVNALAYVIINTDPKSKPGEHWVGIIYDGKGNTVYIYDSFGRKSSALLPKFMSTMKKMKVMSQDSKHDEEQKGASQQTVARES